VITASAISKIWESNPELLAKVDSLLKSWADSCDSRSAIAYQLQSISLACQIPDCIVNQLNSSLAGIPGMNFAVRSSACNEDGSNSSFAGIFESYLNVSKTGIPKAILMCMSSQLTQRSLEYHQTQGQSPSVKEFAVVVQQQIAAEVSGVCFTSVESNQHTTPLMLIESVYGIGESLVDGDVTPDKYLVTASAECVVQKQIGIQRRLKTTSVEGGTGWISVDEARARMQKLSDKQILQLASVCLDIASMQGYACDVEWCVCNGRIYVLQARPITTAIAI
jgi:pyruvate,water dikinase